MSDNQILDVFYNDIVKEAQNGRVDCFFIMNIVFNLVIDNNKITNASEFLSEDILTPTLKITNKQLFDSLLVEYVKKAIEVYNPNDFSFLEDIDIENNNTKSKYLIKYIICTLLANASYSDFDNPTMFLKSRIAMLENRILNTDEEIELGYIDSIGASIHIKEEVSPIKSETPYRIASYLKFDDGYELVMPELYVGDNGKSYQLYGIQKTSKNSDIDEREYLRQIRKGFIAKINGAKEHYFLAAMLLLTLCSDKEIEVVPFLVERWNAKRIAIYNKSKRNTDFNLDDLFEEQENIQNNVTNIFMRYFTKLEDVSTGLDFSLMPFELDSSLHITMSEDFESRSMAFNELFRLANELRKQKNR